MSDDSDTPPRIYGAPDPDNRQPPLPMGIRGEEGAPLGEPDARTSRETVVDGRTIRVEEVSGVTAAEATGKIGQGGEEHEPDAPGSG